LGSKGTALPEEAGDSVPEELFRRYTETDSRPITPAPTVASIVTRSSQVGTLIPHLFVNRNASGTFALSKNQLIRNIFIQNDKNLLSDISVLRLGVV